MKNKVTFNGITDAELDNQIAEMKKERFNLRAQAKAGQNENPTRTRALRRNIARALTEKTARAIAAAKKA